jgi:hypothetical protein
MTHQIHDDIQLVEDAASSLTIGNDGYISHATKDISIASASDKIINLYNKVVVYGENDNNVTIDGNGLVVNGSAGTELRLHDNIVTTNSDNNLIIQAIDKQAQGRAVEINGGDSTSSGNGGAIQCEGGDASGTNKNGGAILLYGGDSTGSGYSYVNISAATAGGSGSTTRSTETYLLADGSDEKLKFYKDTTALADLTVDVDLAVGGDITTSTSITSTSDITCGGNVEIGDGYVNFTSYTHEFLVHPCQGYLVHQGDAWTNSDYNTPLNDAGDSVWILPLTLPNDAVITSVKTKVLVNGSDDPSVTYGLYKKVYTDAVNSNGTEVGTDTSNLDNQEVELSIEGLSETVVPNTCYYIRVTCALAAGSMYMGLSKVEATLSRTMHYMVM